MEVIQTNGEGATESRKAEGQADSSDIKLNGKILVPRIVTKVGSIYGMRYVMSFYGNVTDADSVEVLSHILAHFIDQYWSPLSGQKLKCPRNYCRPHKSLKK